MELAGYNLTFVHIKDKNKMLADSISWLKTLYIYKKTNRKSRILAVSKTQKHVTDVYGTNMHSISTTMLWTEPKWDINCQN